MFYSPAWEIKLEKKKENQISNNMRREVPCNCHEAESHVPFFPYSEGAKISRHGEVLKTREPINHTKSCKARGVLTFSPF